MQTEGEKAYAAYLEAVTPALQVPTEGTEDIPLLLEQCALMDKTLGEPVFIDNVALQKATGFYDKVQKLLFSDLFTFDDLITPEEPLSVPVEEEPEESLLCAVTDVYEDIAEDEEEEIDEDEFATDFDSGPGDVSEDTLTDITDEEWDSWDDWGEDDLSEPDVYGDLPTEESAETAETGTTDFSLDDNIFDLFDNADGGTGVAETFEDDSIVAEEQDNEGTFDFDAPTEFGDFGAPAEFEDFDAPAEFEDFDVPVDTVSENPETEGTEFDLFDSSMNDNAFSDIFGGTSEVIQGLNDVSADENVGTPFDYPTDDSFAESTYDMGTPMDGLYAETDSNTALVPFEGSTAPVEKTANDKLADGIVGLATLLTGGTKKAVKSGGKMLRKAVKAAATAVTVEETDVVEDVETTVVITQQRNNDTE